MMGVHQALRAAAGMAAQPANNPAPLATLYQGLYSLASLTGPMVSPLAAPDQHLPTHNAACTCQGCRASPALQHTSQIRHAPGRQKQLFPVPFMPLASQLPHSCRGISMSSVMHGSSNRSSDEPSVRDLLGEEEGDHGRAGSRGGKVAEAQRALGEIRKQAREDSLEQRAAREVMADPMSRVLASHGMPLGIALDSFKKSANTPDDDFRALSQPPTPEPGYQMEALEEIFLTTGTGSSQQQGTPQQQQRQQAAAAQAAGGSGAAAGGAAGGSAGAGAGGQGRGGGGKSGGKDDDVKAPAAAAAAAAVAGAPVGDSWGTTRESPLEIAKRLVESNAELERQAALIPDAPASIDPADEPMDEAFPAPGEEKYKTLEQMSADIKGLDEVFEVLAQVPWLNEDDLQQKELKGVAMVGLLGTLEEVGFNIRDHVHRVWAGDHDDGMLLDCGTAKDQAALISVLFHTKKLVDEFGPPRAYLPAPPPLSGGGGGAEGGDNKAPPVSDTMLSQLLNMKGPGN